MLRVLRVLSVSPVAAPFSPHCTMKLFFGTVLRGSRVLSVEYYSTASSYLHTPKHSTKKGCRTASSQHLGGMACSSASACDLIQTRCCFKKSLARTHSSDVAEARLAQPKGDSRYRWRLGNKLLAC